MQQSGGCVRVGQARTATDASQRHNGQMYDLWTGDTKPLVSAPPRRGILQMVGVQVGVESCLCRLVGQVRSGRFAWS